MEVTLSQALQQHVDLQHINMRTFLFLLNKFEGERPLSSFTEEELGTINYYLINPPQDDENCESCSG